MKIRISRAKHFTTEEEKLHTHLRLPIIPRPKWADNLRFPSNIVELTSGNVSELLGKYTELWCYANQDLSALNQELLRQEAHEQERINEMIADRPSITGLEKFRKETVFASDRQIANFRRSRKILHIRKAATEMFLANYQAYINALSRELTRKGMHETIGPKYQR